MTFTHSSLVRRQRGRQVAKNRSLDRGVSSTSSEQGGVKGRKGVAQILRRGNDRTITLPQCRDPAIGSIFLFKTEEIGRGFTFLNPSYPGANLRPLSSFRVNVGQLRQDPMVRGKTGDRSGVDPSLEMVSKADKEVPVSGTSSRSVTAKTNREALNDAFPLLPPLSQRRKARDGGTPR